MGYRYATRNAEAEYCPARKLSHRGRAPAEPHVAGAPHAPDAPGSCIARFPELRPGTGSAPMHEPRSAQSRQVLGPVDVP